MESNVIDATVTVGVAVICAVIVTRSASRISNNDSDKQCGDDHLRREIPHASCRYALLSLSAICIFRS